MVLIFHVYTPFAVESGEREMTITDYAVITDAVKWNNHILHLQRLGMLK